jgi:hypothetical protein
MAEKSLVKDDTDSDAALPAAVVVVPPLLLLFEEPQATSAKAVTRATDQTPARFNETFIIPSR